MKRKIILALMTICILSFASCGKQETTATAEPIPTAVESAQVELTETTTETIESTEVVEDNTSEAEAKDESTEAEKTTEVTNIEEAEPLSEKDLAFSFLGYDTYNEYVERRKCLIDGLNRIPGVYSPIPMGAFYTVAKLPVDDSDKFCAWCLSDFEYEGQTVFMAPASGFYTTPGSGINEVRIAYVLKKEDLTRALFVLQKALEAYPGRTE